ncbi:MAG: hypothetical protein JXJ17_09485 [Anaerolineae bacterium]|nr:hypothetical protein [Anaerolineae bacterium]
MKPFTRIIILILSISVIGLGMAACKKEAEEPTPAIIYVTATPEGMAPPTAVEAAPGEVSGVCNHLLWPLHDSAEWRYQLSTAEGTSEIILSSIAIEDGAFLYAGDYEASILCQDNAIIGLPPLPSGDPSLGMGITGSNPIGNYLTYESELLPLGQPAWWDIQMNAGGTINLPEGLGGTITSGSIVLVHETEQLENVTVPAGTFLALAIKQDALFDLQLQLADGSAARVLINTAARIHYAEGAGPVRVSYLGGMISTNGSAIPLEGGATLELVGVTIP